jgi:hypothetical protein
MNDSEMIVIAPNEREALAREKSGAEASGRIELDRLHRGLIDVFEDWLISGKISRRLELELFGTPALYAHSRDGIVRTDAGALGRLSPWIK